VLEQEATRDALLGKPTPKVAKLSEREEEVLRLLARGLTMKTVSPRLQLSPRTVETYKARAMLKLNLRSRADLLRFAVRCGWLDET
jgi:DNA-binding NarL/FixJ family response regulator